MMRALAFASMLSLAAAALTPAGAQPAASSWQGRIQNEDRARLAGLWRAWTGSLADVAAAPGGRDALAALGPVVVPPIEPLPGRPVALASDKLPGIGAYQCRTIRLGRRDDGWPRDSVLPLQTGPWGACNVGAAAGAPFVFVMKDGPQRLSGRLWADGDRMVFLGALHLASEAGTRGYGDDPDRDHLGVLRPLGPDHWRLELPWPRWQSDLLLVELRSAA